MEQQITLTIEDFLNSSFSCRECVAGDKDYVILHIDQGHLHAFREDPVKNLRLAGLLFTYVRSGSLTIGFDNRDFVAEADSIFAIPPTIAARISSPDWDKVELSIAYMSRDFLQTLSFSLSAFSGPVVLEHRSPVCPVGESDGLILRHYFGLLALTAREIQYPRLKRHCASSLCVAMLYQCIAMYMRQLEISGAPTETPGQKTRATHVRSFIRMVHANFARERSVGFYASQLCVSPKYLSALVKEATGRTAARWIEDYVIMEAKNLLRFSGKNIQQIAYALNFANQSAFGKYFKHLTGMSPSEFQKS